MRPGDPVTCRVTGMAGSVVDVWLERYWSKTGKEVSTIYCEVEWSDGRTTEERTTNLIPQYPTIKAPPPDPPPCPNCGGMLTGRLNYLRCLPPPEGYIHDPGVKPGGCGWYERIP